MKSCIIIGSMNAVTYKEIFPLIKGNQLWLGVSPRSMDFVLPNGEASCVNANWFTNIDHNKRHTRLDLYKKYSNEYYPKYDNYDAIEVKYTKEIPYDYDGVMGVPITFLDKYNPEQFEILGIANSARWIGEFECFTLIGGKRIYNRILIRNKQVGQM